MNWFRKLFGNQPSSQAVDRLKPIATVKLPESTENGQLHQDQILRKAWFESVIEDQGIPVNKHLPCIEGEAETTLREPDEISHRLFALIFCAFRAEGISYEQLKPDIAKHNAESWFTRNELAFLAAQEHSDEERVQFSWRYEAAWVLAWGLKLVDDAPLPFPDQPCDVTRLVSAVRDTADLSANGAKSINNVLNEADLIYRYHWAVRQAQIDGQNAPGGLHAGIVMERHYALNWLTRYLGQEWDDVSTDT